MVVAKVRRLVFADRLAEYFLSPDILCSPMSQASSPGRCCWPLSLIRCGGPSATRTRTAAKRALSFPLVPVASENSDSCVSMVWPTKDRLRDNVSEPLNRARAGCVLAERKVSPHLIIVAGVTRKNAPKVIFVEHDHVVRCVYRKLDSARRKAETR